MNDGQMFFHVTRDGRPIRKRRYFFSETFYVIAAAAYAKASGDEEAAKKARRFLENVLSMQPHRVCCNQNLQAQDQQRELVFR